MTPEDIPVIGQVRDGNTADSSWNQELIEILRERLRLDDDEEVVYVADSRVVSGPNLRALAKQKLSSISRLPATFALDETLKTRAWLETTGSSWVL